jgi:hypothetical protein
VIAQVDNTNHLAALWITAIHDDLAGEGLAAFRRLSVRNRSHGS